VILKYRFGFQPSSHNDNENRLTLLHVRTKLRIDLRFPHEWEPVQIYTHIYYIFGEPNQFKFIHIYIIFLENQTGSLVELRFIFQNPCISYWFLLFFFSHGAAATLLLLLDRLTSDWTLQRSGQAKSKEWALLFLVSKQNLNSPSWCIWYTNNHQKQITNEKVTALKVKRVNNLTKQTTERYRTDSQTLTKILCMLLYC
jgi:hypothetical protein